MEEYVTYWSPAGKCHLCDVYAKQTWGNRAHVTRVNHNVSTHVRSVSNLVFSFCDHCNEYSLWMNESLIYPDRISVPLPNEDLPEEIQADYYDAASVLSRSYKASAALLRLCLQKLCIHLGEKGHNINEDIKALVTKGLPATVQRAMDTVRIKGNKAVHPGEIDSDDDMQSTVKLFGLINVIANTMITQPRSIESLYDDLPEGVKEAIKKRDQPKP